MQLEQGVIVEGKVTSITKFGAFVDLGDGRTGMVHISEVSYGFVENIADVLSVDQTVKVMVMKIGDDGKISLSIKRTQEKKAPPPRRPARSKAPVAPPSRPTADDWNSNRSDHMSFEDMMSRFKQNSDEKMCDLKKKNGDNMKRRRSSHKS